MIKTATNSKYAFNSFCLFFTKKSKFGVNYTVYDIKHVIKIKIKYLTKGWGKKVLLKHLHLKENAELNSEISYTVF